MTKAKKLTIALTLRLAMIVAISCNFITKAYATEQIQTTPENNPSMPAAFIVSSIAQPVSTNITSQMSVTTSSFGLTSTDNHHDYSFDIYSAESNLITDIDGDGFYQGFSIIFDADVYGSTYAEVYAEVYAELYFRKEGGPWIHYYASDIFSLYGESENDKFEIITTLAQGFSPDFYDVLIDLYDAHSDQLVASYSSDDSNALYALPLESSDYDQAYVSEVVVYYPDGGSTSLAILLTLFITLLFRRKNNKPTH